jgi:hypothetical protein
LLNWYLLQNARKKKRRRRRRGEDEDAVAVPGVARNGLDDESSKWDGFTVAMRYGTMMIVAKKVIMILCTSRDSSQRSKNLTIQMYR